MPKPTLPTLTMEGLKAAMEPPNNCKVKPFRDALDPDSQRVFDSALSLDGHEFPASAVRRFVLEAGFAEDAIPSEGSISAHRTTRRPCRCRG